MADPPNLPFRGGSGDNNEPDGAPKMLADTQSDEAQEGDKILADLSERLNKSQLDGSTAKEDSTQAPAHRKNKPDESKGPVIAQGSSGAESKVSNSYSKGTAKESDNKASETRRPASHADDEDDVAAGMLIPASSLCILERDTQHDQIVAKLLANNNARVAILGMGGIGKTTLACSIANDSQIEEAYPRRLFLSFEGCSTPDLAYTNLASAFQIPADRRSSHRQILFQVLKYLKQEKTLFVIDNFETFWEISSNRRAAEELLAQLAALPKLAMIVTLRGIQRPGTIRWVKLDPLQTLTQDGSMELLSIITDEEYGDSEYVQKLLKAVSGIPLAITLIGSLLRDESETPQSLWGQWTRESARAIRVANDMDSDDRLYKLDISLRLSVFGPRMSDNSKAALAAISILPVGMNMDEGWLNRFQNLLPNPIRIRDCIRVLRDVALAILDSSTTPPRLRLLSPVRDFCLNNLTLDNSFSRSLIDIYNSDLIARWDPGPSDNHLWITTELSNITAILNHAIVLRYVTHDFGRATYHYSEWRRFLCIPDMDVIERAIDVLSEHPTAKALCLQAFGSTLSIFNREHEGLQRLELALSIHREFGSKSAVGWCLYLLGNAYRRVRNYADAERCLDEARDLFTEIGHHRRRGSVLRVLSRTYLIQDKLLQAQEAAKEALDLSRASNNLQGEANALGVLGDAYRLQGKYDLAVETLTASTNASKAIHDIHGEACGNESLGLLYHCAEKPDQASLHLRLAISLFERAHDSKAADRARNSLTTAEPFIPGEDAS